MDDLRRLGMISDPSQTDSEKLIHTFISSRADYCHALFARVSKSSVGHNATTRILTGKFDHTEALKAFQQCNIELP